MRDIGFVADDFKDRPRGNRHRPDELFPRRLERGNRVRARFGFGRRRWRFELDPWCGMNHRARLESWRRMDAGTRENLGLRMKAYARLDDRRWDDASARAELAAGDVGGADG